MLAKPIMRWPGINRQHPLASRLLAYWPIWEGAGSFAGDIVGTRDLALTNMDPGSDWTGTPLGYGLDLDGTDEYLVTTFPPGFDLTAPWSLGGWCVVDSPSSLTLALMFALVQSGDTNNIGLGTSNSPAGELKIITSGETPGQGSAIPDGVPIHLMLVWDGTDFLSYLNGVFEYQVTPGGSLWQNANRIAMGREHLASSDYLTGRVIDGGLWQRIISPSEAREMFNTPFALFRPYLYPYLHLAVGVAAGNLLLRTRSMSGRIQELTGYING
jgi:hypothetical protein